MVRRGSCRGEVWADYVRMEARKLSRKSALGKSPSSFSVSESGTGCSHTAPCPNICIKAPRGPGWATHRTTLDLLLSLCQMRALKTWVLVLLLDQPCCKLRTSQFTSRFGFFSCLKKKKKKSDWLPPQFHCLECKCKINFIEHILVLKMPASIQICWGTKVDVNGWSTISLSSLEWP